MNQKHLLNFIKAKLKHEPDEVRVRRSPQPPATASRRSSVVGGTCRWSTLRLSRLLLTWTYPCFMALAPCRWSSAAMART